jgi:membrane protease YdiL (CAAX protease family)
MSSVPDPRAGWVTTVPVGPTAKGYPLVAWSAIIVVVAAVSVGQRVLPLILKRKQRADNVQLPMQYRQYVAVAKHYPSERDKLYNQADSTKPTSEEERLMFVVLTGELKGPKEALERLQELGNPFDDAHVAALLNKLYRDYDAGEYSAPSLTAGERTELHDKLGWFGDLALNPEHAPDEAARAAVLAPAEKAFFAMMGFVLGVMALAVVGSFLLFVMTGLVLLRIAPLHFRTGSRNGGIYAETFAVWMVLFLVLELAGAFVAMGPYRLLAAGAANLLSLSALAWPVFRGIPWKIVRAEIGLVWKDRTPVRTAIPFTSPALLEPVYGLGAYLATLPLAFVGILLVYGLMQMQKALFGNEVQPTHPIVGEMNAAGWWGRLQLILLATVFAPILEETMFRGVLYRHLREVTGKAGRFWSVLASACVVSFVFAVIHPQGFVAVPALMALAIGFSLAREWRGTLIPAMVAHGLNNALVTAVLLVNIS